MFNLNKEIAVINGKDSRDFGIYLIDGNIFDYPKREIEYLTVPGRSGSLTIDKGRWENIDITYTFAAYDNAVSRLNAWKEYLLAALGYTRIETSVEPEIYRKGILKSATSPQLSMMGGGGTIEVTYNCMPQKWLKENDGVDEEITLTNNMYINNPTNFDAKPLLYLKAGQVGATVSFLNNLYDKTDDDYYLIAESILKVNTTDRIWIDCETCDAFYDDTNYNAYVELVDDPYNPSAVQDFPVISGQSKHMQHPNFLRRQIYDASVTTRILIGDFTYAQMYPRWWKL